MLADRRLPRSFLLVAFLAAEIFYGAAVAILADDSYLVLVAIVGLAVIIATFIDPMYGLYAFMVTMFAEQLLLISSVTLTKLIGIFVFGVWLIRSLAHKHVEIKIPKHTWIIILFAAWGLLSVMWASSEQRVFERLQVLLPNILLYILLVNLLNSPKRVQGIITVLIISGTGLALLTLFYLFSGKLTAGRVAVYEVSGQDPNSLALYLLPNVALMIALFGQKIQALNKLFIVCGLLISALAILATGSRGALIALAIIFLLGSMLNQKVWPLMFLVLIAVGVGTLFFLPPTYINRLQSIVTLSDRGAARLYIWLVGLQMIQAHPLLGVGLGNYSIAWNHFLPITPSVSGAIWAFKTSKGSHNIFLNAFSELGVIGFVLFTAWIGISVKQGWSALMGLKKATAHYMAAWSSGVWLGLIAMVIAGFFLDMQYRKYFWVLLALTHVCYELSRIHQAKDMPTK